MVGNYGILDDEELKCFKTIYCPNNLLFIQIYTSNLNDNPNFIIHLMKSIICNICTKYKQNCVEFQKTKFGTKGK